MTLPPDQIRELERLEAELPKAPWHCATNKHAERFGVPWGALEIVRHPAGGAGKSIATWKGAESQQAIRDLAQLRNLLADALPELLAAYSEREELLREVETALDSVADELPPEAYEALQALRAALDSGAAREAADEGETG